MVHIHVPAVSRNYSNACSSYSAKTKRDGQTEGGVGGLFNISRPFGVAGGR